VRSLLLLRWYRSLIAATSSVRVDMLIRLAIRCPRRCFAVGSIVVEATNLFGNIRSEAMRGVSFSCRPTSTAGPPRGAARESSQFWPKKCTPAHGSHVTRSSVASARHWRLLAADAPFAGGGPASCRFSMVADFCRHARPAAAQA
jgi:hypothetical protein